MKQYKWSMPEIDAETLDLLKETMPGTREALCKIFVRRGLNSFEKAKDFFNPDMSTLPSPFLLKDMEKAVDRIIDATADKEKILLFGDYDVDGTTAVALMYRYLKKISDPEKIDYYIPDRNSEGYGLSANGIDYAVANHATLVITLDCGITNSVLIDNAPPSLDFIICDHHIPGINLPKAVAILNPKQASCNYPFKELCGCGIAFKLVCAINKKLGLPEKFCEENLDLVAVAIGADIVTMTGENRILCFHGLKKLNTTPVTGLKALMEVAGAGYYDNYKSIFQLAPRINAAGRMDHGRIAVSLLIESDYERALTIAKSLQEHNETRKAQHTQITNEAIDIIQRNGWQQKTTVVHREGWHKGVLGIVASKLQETYYRPTIVLTTQDGITTGSARSIKDFNIYEALAKCGEHLSQFGGHTAAAGLSLRPEELESFSRKFERVVDATISDDHLVAELVIDATLGFDDIDFKFYNTLKRMEPFGPDNSRPVFITRKAIPSEYTQLVKDKHIRFVFQNERSANVYGIGFDMKEKFSLIQPGVPIDVVYNISENQWNNHTSLQLRIIDFMASETYT